MCNLKQGRKGLRVHCGISFIFLFNILFIKICNIRRRQRNKVGNNGQLSAIFRNISSLSCCIWLEMSLSPVTRGKVLATECINNYFYHEYLKKVV